MRLAQRVALRFVVALAWLVVLPGCVSGILARKIVTSRELRGHAADAEHEHGDDGGTGP